MPIIRRPRGGGSGLRTSSAFPAPSTLFSVALTLACLAAPVVAFAGAWTPARGAVYNRIAVNHYAAEEQFDASGERVDLPLHGDFLDWNVVDYFEYGVTDCFAAFGSITAKRLRSENDLRVTTTKGIGDADLGVRARLLQGTQGVFSVQALGRIPTGYEETDLIPLGTGEPEIEARLLYGRSLWPLLPGYFGVEAGFRRRGGAPEDEFRYLVETGSGFGAGLYFRAKLDGVRGLETGVELDASGNPTVRNSYDLGTLDVTLGRKLGSRFTIEAGFAPALYGKTVSAGSAFTLALAFSHTPIRRTES